MNISYIFIHIHSNNLLRCLNRNYWVASVCSDADMQFIVATILCILRCTIWTAKRNFEIKLWSLIPDLCLLLIFSIEQKQNCSHEYVPPNTAAIRPPKLFKLQCEFQLFRKIWGGYRAASQCSLIANVNPYPLLFYSEWIVEN